MKKIFRRIIPLAIIVALFGSLALIFLLSGSIGIELEDKRLDINVYYLGKTPVASSFILDYTECEIEYLEDFSDLGTCLSDVNIWRLDVGEFKNDLFGFYRLYKYKKNSGVIVLKSDSSVYVFNEKTKEKTRNLYQNLIKYQQEQNN